MGGSGSLGPGHGNIARPIYIEEHHVQIWGPTFALLEQWATIHQQSIPAILYGVWDEECLLLPSVSSIQWAGPGHEQNFAQVLEKVLDKGEREVGG